MVQCATMVANEDQCEVKYVLSIVSK